jgi:hypothetical protein
MIFCFNSKKIITYTKCVYVNSLNATNKYESINDNLGTYEGTTEFSALGSIY